MDYRFYIVSIIFSFLIIPSTALAQVLDENSIQKSVKVEINSTGDIHVTHVIKASSTLNQIDLITGKITNLSIRDQNDEELQYGVINENSIMIFPSTENVIVEYDLSDVLILKNNVWSWDFLYLTSTSFYFPEGVDLVFVDSKPAFLGDKKGIACHGCKMKLEYSLNEPKFSKEIKMKNEKYFVEFRTWTAIKNLNFDKDLGGLNFFVPDDGVFITTIIPKNLISKPYNVLLDNEKIFFNTYNENGTHAWLNLRPQHSGEISIIGIVIPEISDENSIQLLELQVEYLVVIFVLIGIVISFILFKRKNKGSIPTGPT